MATNEMTKPKAEPLATDTDHSHDGGRPRRAGTIKHTTKHGASIRSSIPRSLALGAAWSWRLLLVGIAAYAAVQVLTRLSLVVIPLVAALLLAAFLQPVTELLHRRLPGPLSALLTLLLAVVALGGLGYVIGQCFAQQVPSLIEQLVGTVRQLRADLAGAGVAQVQLDQIERLMVDWLQSNRNQAVGHLTTGAGYLFEFLALAVLTLFIAFFLLYDGERIWRWVLSPLPPRELRRVDVAGRAAWSTITGYMRGIVVIAIIHGIVIGFVLFLLGVPLAIPLAVLVFLGAFIPFIGALVAGGLAVLVTFGTQGWLAALILLGVLLAQSQLEAHLLQPLIVGRYVRLHPLAVGLAFAVGTVLAGIVGAIVAVPTAAIIHQAWPALRGQDQE